MPAPLPPVNVRFGPAGIAPSPTARTLLQASDFSYLGFYDLRINGNNTPYGQGLTHRYVNGELRFLTYSFVSGYVLDEFSIAGLAFGSKITARTKRWSNTGLPGGSFHAHWYEEATGRLWSTSAVDYTATFIPTRIYTRTLNDDGTISNLHGPVSLLGIPAKRVYGGAQAIPAWFQQQYGVGPYAVGWGGYTSLVDQGGKASMGPALYAVPDPAAYADGATIPAGQFKTLADHAGNHRGRRVTIPINYYDNGDPRQNPSTPPTVPPSSTAGWQSPGPDGLGYWVWGDSYYNTGCWIETPTKHGFVAIGSFGGGKCYYMKSTLNCDIRQFERHIFDPADFGAVASGRKLPSSVSPTHLTELTLAGLGEGDSGNTTWRNVCGATFDARTNTHYLLGNRFSALSSRLYAFRVAA